MTDESHYDEIMGKVADKAAECGRNVGEIKVIAVSKECSIEAMQAVYRMGVRDFGESRVMEGIEKKALMPNDCRWHLLGKLQSKKIRRAIQIFDLIHSVDTFELAQGISKVGMALDKEVSILLQVNISGEKTKQGCSAEEWEMVLREVNQLSNIKIEGLMTMAPFVEDEKVIRSCFRTLYELRARWQQRMKQPETFCQLSMGMSHDYLIAIEEGATILRIGNAIFGSSA